MNDLWYSGQKFNNPRIMLDHCLKNARRISLTNNGFVEFTPVEGLKLRSQFTYYSYQRHGRYYEPGYLPAKKENEGGYASRDEYDDTSSQAKIRSTTNCAPRAATISTCWADTPRRSSTTTT